MELRSVSGQSGTDCSDSQAVDNGVGQVNFYCFSSVSVDRDERRKRSAAVEVGKRTFRIHLHTY